MNNPNLMSKLVSLLHMEFDTVRVYNDNIPALVSCGDEVMTTLSVFRDDHRRHITVLSGIIRGFGGIVPELFEEMHGYATEGTARVRVTVAPEKAMSSLKEIERHTLHLYNDACADPDFLTYEAQARDQLLMLRAEETHHNEYIGALSPKPAVAARI
jgi:hypothetical protein